MASKFADYSRPICSSFPELEGIQTLEQPYNLIILQRFRKDTAFEYPDGRPCTISVATTTITAGYK